MGHSPPPLRQSATFPAGELPILSEKSGASKADSASSFKRYSDESKESKIPSMLRKKSGFSGFMNSLVGSPKKPLISAPENPVHLTHVGYDSSTGQFTVWDSLACMCALHDCGCADLVDRGCPRSGSGLSTRAASLRRTRENTPRSSSMS